MTCPICDEHPVDCSCARQALRRLVEALPTCDVVTDYDTKPMTRCGLPAFFGDEAEEWACDAHESWRAPVPVPWSEQLRHALRVLGDEAAGSDADDDEWRVERGRAITPQGKRLIVERLLAAWLRAPEQRLGQLIGNSVPLDRVRVVEDVALVVEVERFAGDEPKRGES